LKDRLLNRFCLTGLVFNSVSFPSFPNLNNFYVHIGIVLFN